MKNRNIFWGFIFIFAAVFVLLSNLGYFEDINFTKILVTVLLVYCMIKNIRPRNFFGILIPAAFICILYDDFLQIEELTPFPVLTASILGSIGLSFLFPGRPNVKGHAFDGDVFCEKAEHINGPDIHCKVTFGETSKYIDTPDFRRAHLKCTFGSLKVYFDHTHVDGDTAEIYVDNAFGETELYLPGEWNVKLEASATFGDIEEVRRTTNAGFPVVTVRGHVSFGECKIYYI